MAEAKSESEQKGPWGPDGGRPSFCTGSETRRVQPAQVTSMSGRRPTPQEALRGQWTEGLMTTARLPAAPAWAQAAPCHRTGPDSCPRELCAFRLQLGPSPVEGRGPRWRRSDRGHAGTEAGPGKTGWRLSPRHCRPAPRPQAPGIPPLSLPPGRAGPQQARLLSAGASQVKAREASPLRTHRPLLTGPRFCGCSFPRQCSTWMWAPRDHCRLRCHSSCGFLENVPQVSNSVT